MGKQVEVVSWNVFIRIRNKVQSIQEPPLSLPYDDLSPSTVESTMGVLSGLIGSSKRHNPSLLVPVDQQQKLGNKNWIAFSEGLGIFKMIDLLHTAVSLEKYFFSKPKKRQRWW